jgi:hypothetical protein
MAKKKEEISVLLLDTMEVWLGNIASGIALLQTRVGRILEG